MRRLVTKPSDIGDGEKGKDYGTCLGDRLDIEGVEEGG